MHSDVTRTRSDLHLSQTDIKNILGEKGSKYKIMIYDPASDEVLTQERTISTK